MRHDKLVLSLVVITVVLAMLLTVGIGYAVEADNSLINDKSTTREADGFNVAFLDNTQVRGDGETTVKITGDREVAIAITGLNEVGDSATAILTIKNTSRDIAAELSATITNTNTEYFKATVDFSNDVIDAKNGKATVKLTVELIKLPILNDVHATIETNIVATPIMK